MKCFLKIKSNFKSNNNINLLIFQKTNFKITFEITLKILRLLNHFLKLKDVWNVKLFDEVIILRGSFKDLITFSIKDLFKIIKTNDT